LIKTLETYGFMMAHNGMMLDKLLDRKAQQVSQVQQVLEPQALPEPLAQLEQPVLLDHKAKLVPQASQVMWVPLVRQAYRAKLVPQVHQVYKDS
jgi:hypothetical protein